MVADLERSDAGTGARKWIGRIVVGVLLGQAIWNLIVSAINNVFVPWLGDLIGQSSQLPSSFTQRPYDYPDFLVSVLESCIAVIIAMIVNYLIVREGPEKLISPKIPVWTRAEVAPVITESSTHQSVADAISPIAYAAADAEKSHLAESIPSIIVPQALDPLAPAVPLEAAAETSTVTAEAASVVTSRTEEATSQLLKTETANPKKHSEIFYNSVGEPLPIDEDGN